MVSGARLLQELHDGERCGVDRGDGHGGVQLQLSTSFWVATHVSLRAPVVGT